VWLPDGRALVFSAVNNGYQDLHRKELGGGEDEVVYHSADKGPYNWSKDGRILFNTGRDFFQFHHNSGIVGLIDSDLARSFVVRLGVVGGSAVCAIFLTVLSGSYSGQAAAQTDPNRKQPPGDRDEQPALRFNVDSTLVLIPATVTHSTASSSVCTKRTSTFSKTAWSKLLKAFPARMRRYPSAWLLTPAAVWARNYETLGRQRFNFSKR